jgi:hypothetical protein
MVKKLFLANFYKNLFYGKIKSVFFHSKIINVDFFSDVKIQTCILISIKKLFK